MRNCLTITICVIALFLSNWAEASPKFAGRWTRTQFSFNVTIEKWGENCGPKPKSYANNKKKSVEIISQGKHLVFSKGGIRTDRCISPNPRLSTISESIVTGNWRRICQTAPSDSKYERAEYSLKATGNDQLDYRSKTKVNWSLKGDQCVATLKDHSVFTRDETDGPKGESSGNQAPEKKPEPEEEEEDPRPECDNPGQAKRLSINPAEATIGPGERVCFRVMGVDDNGCRFPVSTTWSLYQDGHQITDLLSKTGCFNAGSTAADSEGTYDVLAKASGKQANALVTVAFPDLDDLLKAKLNPVDELGRDSEPQENSDRQGLGAVPGGQNAISPPMQAAAATPSQNDSKKTIVIIVVIVGIILALGLLAAALIIRRKSASAPIEEDWDDDDFDQYPQKIASQAPKQSAAPKPAPSLSEDGKNEEMQCPSCNRNFPAGAQFCPHDASALVKKNSGNRMSSQAPGRGMVCPKCHRGYDPEAQFCPHDSSKLVPYKDWRQTNL